jgi:hypothetical protein
LSAAQTPRGRASPAEIIAKPVMHHTMKTITLLLIILINFTCLSQDTRLFEQTWILHDLILDGQSYIPPINNEQNFIPADFVEPDIFSTGVCEETGGNGEIVYNGTSEFSFPMGIAWLAGSCNLKENEMYNNLYQTFWNSTLADPFQYEIIDVGPDRTLTVTASNGNQAIYGTDFLSVPEFKNAHIQIYPIPVNDIINLEYVEDISINRVIIYDIHGRQVLFITKNISQINVQNLKTGIYFISIENDAAEILTKKFVKR